jgi:hypothetical protein
VTGSGVEGEEVEVGFEVDGFEGVEVEGESGLWAKTYPVTGTNAKMIQTHKRMTNIPHSPRWQFPKKRGFPS